MEGEEEWRGRREEQEEVKTVGADSLPCVE